MAEIQPLTDKLGLLRFSILFFAVVLLLTAIRPAGWWTVVGPVPDAGADHWVF
ncbi:MAG: hypothetical protein ACLUJG_08685 [Lawsonibacter sp.]